MGVPLRIPFPIIIPSNEREPLGGGKKLSSAEFTRRGQVRLANPRRPPPLPPAFGRPRTAVENRETHRLPGIFTTRSASPSGLTTEFADENFLGQVPHQGSRNCAWPGSASGDAWFLSLREQIIRGRRRPILGAKRTSFRRLRSGYNRPGPASRRPPPSPPLSAELKPSACCLTSFLRPLADRDDPRSASKCGRPNPLLPWRWGDHLFSLERGMVFPVPRLPLAPLA